MKKLTFIALAAIALALSGCAARTQASVGVPTCDGPTCPPPRVY